MIDGLVAAFQDLMTWPGPLYLGLGALIGLFVGILPGLGGAGGMALLLPFTLGMEPSYGLAFLMAVGVTSQMGGQITSILVSVPGDVPNAATVLDGYEMTKRGRATEAVSAGTFAGIIGAIIGMGLMLALLPLAQQLVLAFSYPEFFMIALTGLVLISRLTGKSLHKGLIAAGLGLMIAFIGLDPVSGNPRFNFDTLYLWDGIDLTPTLIGLMAGVEMIALFSLGANRTPEAMRGHDSSGIGDGFLAVVRNWWLVIRSSLIGFGAGLVPGISGTLASFLSYGHAYRTSKNREEFGHGAVEGLIAPETANDADKGGAMLPTLAFGIPGGVSWAVLLSGLLLHGVPAGPNLLRGDLHIVYVLVIAAFLPRLFAACIVLALGTRAGVVLRIRGDVLAPVIVVIALLSVYSLRNEPIDVVVLIACAFLGYGMVRYDFSRLTFIIGLVLGGLFEQSYHQTMATFGPSGFFTRPFSLALLLLAMLTLFGPPLWRLARPQRNPEDKIDAKP